jgi:hypothetical protein
MGLRSSGNDKIIDVLLYDNFSNGMLYNLFQSETPGLIPNPEVKPVHVESYIYTYMVHLEGNFAVITILWFE